MRVVVSAGRSEPAVTSIPIVVDGSDAATSAYADCASTSGGGSGVTFDLTMLTDETAAITVELYRRGGKWRVRAVGVG